MRDDALAAYVVSDWGPIGRDPALALDPQLAIEIPQRHEAQYLYGEIVTRQRYLRHGITLAPGAVVWDVGAHVGVFTLFVAQHVPDAQVTAFEPVPELATRLARNCARHGVTARLEPIALGATAGWIPFTYYPGYTTLSGATAWADAAGDAAVVTAHLQWEEAQGAPAGWAADHAAIVAERLTAESRVCPLTTLSAYLAAHPTPRIDLLKVDVQRAELDVLMGIQPADWARIQQVVLEVHDAPTGSHGGTARGGAAAAGSAGLRGGGGAGRGARGDGSLAGVCAAGGAGRASAAGAADGSRGAAGVDPGGRAGVAAGADPRASGADVDHGARAGAADGAGEDRSRGASGADRRHRHPDRRPAG